MPLTQGVAGPTLVQTAKWDLKIYEKERKAGVQMLHV